MAASRAAASPADLHALVARDLMTSEPVCAEPSMPLASFARLLDDDEISGAPVVDAQGRAIGVASRTDLFRHLGTIEHDADAAPVFEMLMRSNDEPELEASVGGLDVRVEDFMSGDPITCGPDEPATAVAARMRDARVHRVVVVDGERQVLGIVTSMDLVRAVAGGG